VSAREETSVGPAIRVRGISKTFAIPRHRAWTLKERLRRPVASFGNDRLEALGDVSFDVAPGEFFAVIGRNGSGKSTLLRCIAGIHEPDTGRVEVNAPVAPFIELGVGFHPILAAADNVTVAGTLMGLRSAEARRRFPQVISFAELEEFVDMPLANYSTGMQVRLAFSTSFQVDADVLLFDEVLAVGDALFQRKCLDTFARLIASGHTIVYVSHSLETVRQFADRVLLLDRGRMVELGEPDAVIAAYERRNREHAQRRGLDMSEPDGRPEVVDAWVESESGRRTSVLRRGERARFRFIVRLPRDTVRPELGFGVRNAEGQVVARQADERRPSRSGTVTRAGELETFSASFPGRLEPGTYEAFPLLAPGDEAGPAEPPGCQVQLRVEEAASGTAAPPRAPVAPGRLARARRFADVSLTLARADFKLRYLDSAIGYAWALAQPLLLFAVLYLIWTEVIRLPGDVSDYGLKLLLGIALFTYFTEAVGHALPALVAKGEMLRKIPFPALALPLASVLTSSYVYSLSLVIVLAFVLGAGISPSPEWLEIVPLLLLLVAFTFGVALLLSLLYVYIRDVQPIWVVVSRLLFFLTPVFYPVELAPQSLQQLLMLNPLAVVIVQARHVLIDPASPTAADAAGGPAWLALSLAFIAAILAAGLVLYRRQAGALAERI
jgi:ABC-type polysaccharide/polyol phosphate transport system ATPase subunit/ABC-type polysaccharide/polyol phosphate export permease